MPTLKGSALSAGPWRNPRRLGGRISQTFCAARCGTRLHEELVARGITTHPMCAPEDRECPAPPA